MSQEARILSQAHALLALSTAGSVKALLTGPSETVVTTSTGKTKKPKSKRFQLNTKTLFMTFSQNDTATRTAMERIVEKWSRVGSSSPGTTPGWEQPSSLYCPLHGTHTFWQPVVCRLCGHWARELSICTWCEGVPEVRAQGWGLCCPRCAAGQHDRRPRESGPTDDPCRPTYHGGQDFRGDQTGRTWSSVPVPCQDSRDNGGRSSLRCEEPPLNLVPFEESTVIPLRQAGINLVVKPQPPNPSSVQAEPVVARGPTRSWQDYYDFMAGEIRAVILDPHGRDIL